jgi:hypothetical protein
MNCIFCYKNSDDSKSVEHVIPESLGNHIYILDKGIVCDQCNQYFSRTFEQQVLDLPFFKEARHATNIKSKKGKIPNGKGFIIDPDLAEIEFLKDKDLTETISIPGNIKVEKDIAAFIPVYGSPGFQNVYVSKFLGKMGIEALVLNSIHYKTPIEDDVNQICFEEVKKYVRAGQKNQYWPYYERSLYHPDAGFKNPKNVEYFKVTSSFKFIYTDTNQILFQYLCMGTEFTIDLVNADTLEFENWLKKNNNESPVLKQVLSYQYL